MPSLMCHVYLFMCVISPYSLKGVTLTGLVITVLLLKQCLAIVDI